MLASAHVVYEVRIIPCLRACVSGVEGALQRYVQEYWGNSWESRHAYPSERKASVVGLPCANWSEDGVTFLMSPR